MLEVDEEVGRGDSTITMRDMDGSLTGYPGSVVTKTDTYFTEGEDCTEIEGWNLQRCDGHFAKVN